MLAFRRVEESGLKKILNSGFFQFCLVVLLGLLVSYAVVQSDKPQQWIQKINRFSSVGATSNAKAQALSEEAPPIQALTETDPSVVTAPPPTAPATSETQAVATTSATVQVSATVSLEIEMIEIETEYLTALLRQAQVNNTMIVDGDVKAAALSSVSIYSSQHYKKLKSTRVTLDGPTPSNNMAGLQRSENPLGLAYNFILRPTPDGQRVVSIAITKVHASDPFEFPIDFAVKQDISLLIAGNAFLTYFEMEPELANISPFQIFKSPDFRNQRTTFAIVLTPLTKE